MTASAGSAVAVVAENAPSVFNELADEEKEGGGCQEGTEKRLQNQAVQKKRDGSDNEENRQQKTHHQPPHIRCISVPKSS